VKAGEAMASGEKTCFVIAPIGPENSDVRKRSDQVLKHIISPAAQECGYKPLRADQIAEIGLITSQVIQHIVDDPLVIADLTGHNPNVFYELSLRHALKRPVVQIIDIAEKIPFDIAHSRIIQVDLHDLDSVAQAKEGIVKQIRAVEKNPADVDTPISVAVELQFLRQSENPVEKSNAEIIAMLHDLRRGILDINEYVRRSFFELTDKGKYIQDFLPTRDYGDLYKELQNIPGTEEERLRVVRQMVNALKGFMEPRVPPEAAQATPQTEPKVSSVRRTKGTRNSAPKPKGLILPRRPS
jgi:hypothetical protein